MTLKRAVSKLQMVRMFGGVPCKLCNKQYVEFLNHERQCTYHATNAVRVGTCRICEAHSRELLDCCGTCPACAPLNTCQVGEHVPKYVMMVTSSSAQATTSL